MNERGRGGGEGDFWINGEWGGDPGWLRGNGEAGEGKRRWGEVRQQSRRDRGFMNERDEALL